MISGFKLSGVTYLSALDSFTQMTRYVCITVDIIYFYVFVQEYVYYDFCKQNYKENYI